MQGDFGVAVNHGTISSMTANASSNEAVQITGANVLFQNFGSVSALGFLSIGVDAASQTGARIENYGSISSGSICIAGGAAGDIVVNRGVLSGAVNLGAGADSFDGNGGSAVSLGGGTGNDTIRCGDEDDTVQAGDDNDEVQGGGGADTLLGDGGNDSLRGGADDDRLVGGLGNDTIRGGAGEDQIESGGGTDILTGGGDRDVFVFATAADIGLDATADHIADFKRGEDIIDLSTVGLTVFIGGQGFHAVAGELRYDKATGRLEGDLTGDGLADFSLFLAGGPKLSETDLVI